MAIPQTVVQAYGQPAGFAGLGTITTDTWSAMNAEASANIGFGLGVKPGVKLKEALLPTASTSTLQGIVLWSAVYAPGQYGSVDQTATVKGLVPKTMMTLLTEGRVWVRVDADTVITANVTRGLR